MSSTKIFVPQPGHDTPIVGILQRATKTDETRGRKLVLIVHGVAAHKDQLYHKRLANELAERRGLDSFRYDLRAQGGESGGKWGMGNMGDDADDMHAVIDFLTREYGYRIHCIMAHSRGSMTATYYLSTHPSRPHVPYFVNLSGRYDMSRVLKADSRWGDLIHPDGTYNKKAVVDWRPKVAGKELHQKIHWQDLASFAEWDNSYLQHSFPQDVHVLTVHGDADETVPVADAHTYHTIFSRRSPGTHKLSIIPGHGHNYKKPYDEPVASIMAWLDEVDPAQTPVAAAEPMEMVGCSPKGGKPRL